MGFRTKACAVPTVITRAVISVDLTVTGLICIHSVRIESEHACVSGPVFCVGKVQFVLLNRKRMMGALGGRGRPGAVGQGMTTQLVLPGQKNGTDALERLIFALIEPVLHACRTDLLPLLKD